MNFLSARFQCPVSRISKRVALESEERCKVVDRLDRVVKGRFPLSLSTGTTCDGDHRDGKLSMRRPTRTRKGRTTARAKKENDNEGSRARVGLARNSHIDRALRMELANISNHRVVEQPCPGRSLSSLLSPSSLSSSFFIFARSLNFSFSLFSSFSFLPGSLFR